MEVKLTNAAQHLCDGIVEMYESGLSCEEIAARILTADAETASFRIEVLVQIVIEYATRHAGDKRNG